MKTFKKALITILILTAIHLITMNPLSAQNGDPPPPPGEHGQNGNQPPGGVAPVGNGLLLLLMLAGGYTVWRLHKFRTANNR
jgi:hypothetical protein